MFRRWLGPSERETVATQVTMEDGTEGPLVDHMRDAHQKGTGGYTEEYLGDLHRNLHQRRREPGEELEHRHPGAAGAQGMPEAMNAKHRDREEQGMSGSMKTKNRDRQRNQDAGNGKHRDRYQPQGAQVPDQRSPEAQQMDNGEAADGEHRDRDEDMVSAGSAQQDHQRTGSGKHRKPRH
jgi:hypothetical protein